MIALASDHAAYEFKSRIKEHLESKGIAVLDCGTFDGVKSCDYSDFAVEACKAVQSGKCEKAIVICGTGIGMSMAANKMKGIRCALCSDTFSARMTRLHNDANALAMGERVLGLGLALDIVDTFLSTEYSAEERHSRRIAKVMKIEEGK